MQIVGRACEVCDRPIESEIDGVGCARCQRFFHDACVLAPPPEPPRSETYRDAATRPKRPRKPKQKVRCPGCGADVRLELAVTNRIAAAQREGHEERRRIAAAGGDQETVWRYGIIRLAVGLLLTFLVLVLRCAHR